MKIAIEVSPLKSKYGLAHRVRGTGFYIDNLRKSLLQYFPQHKYIFFTRGEKIPREVDIVHYPYFEPFFLTMPFRKAHRTVVTVHDLTPLVFPEHFPSGIKGRIKWHIQRMMLRKVDIIITDSRSSRNDIIKHAGISDRRIEVVYLAAGEEFKKIKNSSTSWRIRIQNLKTKYMLPDKFVLYVGDVTWNKNLPRLIEAVKRANVTLVMVGKALIEKDFDRSNPWNQDLLEVQNLTEGDKKIIRLGFVSTEDLIALYNMATVFVMPSIYEGFGLPILEAMNCGCPVITTRSGSIPEVAGDAALYVDAYNADSIKKGIMEVFSSAELQAKLSNIGLKRARTFSWRKTAEHTIGAYNKIV